MQYLFQYILLILLSLMPRFQFLLICLFCSVSHIWAQEDSTKLLYAKKFDSDAFVELGSQIMQFNENAAMNIDFSANWLVNHKYYLGASYTQLANVEQILSGDKLVQGPFPVFNQKTTIKYQTAGIRFGYIVFHDHKVISLSPDLTASWAGIKLITQDEEVQVNGGLLSPAVKAVFNISDYFRIGLGINYNVFIFGALDTSDDDDFLYVTQLKSSSLSGVGGNVFFRIGQF